MKFAAYGALLCFFVAVSPALGQPATKSVTVIPVKYDGLKQEVVKHRGKVVVVDFWATYCPPCIASFPKYIALQQKHADKGLVVISVSLDNFTDEETIEGANKFLTRNQSPLRNLILQEPTELWQEKLGFKALPCYFVFDRQGRWVRFRAEDTKTGVDFTDVERTVVQMLSEK